MKKISLLLILILCVTLFSGCLNADSVSLINIYGDYINLLNAYPYTDMGNIQMFNGEKQFDLYSSGSYSPAIFQVIDSANEENFALLKKGNEYETILTSAMNFFYSYGESYLSLLVNDEKVPQELKTSLYYALEDLSNKTNQVYKDKMSLEILCGDSFANTDSIINNSLKKYLASYQNLIGSAINFDLIFSNICLNYINAQVPSTTIYTGGVPQLILSAQLHVANYIYQSQMVFDTDVTKPFKDEALFLKLKALVDLYKANPAISFEALNNDATATVYFNEAKDIESHFTVEFANLSKSVNELNHTVPNVTDSKMAYYTYLIEFERTNLTYIDIVTSVANLVLGTI